MMIRLSGRDYVHEPDWRHIRTNKVSNLTKWQTRLIAGIYRNTEFARLSTELHRLKFCTYACAVECLKTQRLITAEESEKLLEE